MAPLRPFRGIQALRLVAAVLVLFTHAGFYASERLSPGFRYWDRGAVGVELFFVISGFVMVYSSTRLTGQANGWRTFSERRIVRIVPMYWLATTLKLALMILTAGWVLHAQLRAVPVICSYLFLPSRNPDGELRPLLGVGWTLNFEMFFYLLFAVALYLRKNVYWIIGPTLVTLTVASYFVKPNWPAPAFYLDRVVLDFFWGMLIGGMFVRGVQQPRWLAAPALVAGILFLLILPDTEWKVPVIGMAAAAIVWATAALEPALTRIPRWVLFLGDASYAIYLFHPMIAPAVPALLMRLHWHHPLVSVACSIVLALLAGAVIHQWIERPIGDRQKKLRLPNKSHVALRTASPVSAPSAALELSAAE
jgi:exopolysaccharide production protein ExoZ